MAPPQPTRLPQIKPQQTAANINDNFEVRKKTDSNVMGNADPWNGCENRLEMNLCNRRFKKSRARQFQRTAQRPRSEFRNGVNQLEFADYLAVVAYANPAECFVVDVVRKRADRSIDEHALKCRDVNGAKSSAPMCRRFHRVTEVGHRL